MADDVSFEWRRKWIEFSCEHCGLPFWSPPSRIKRGKRFCSRKCMGMIYSDELLGNKRGLKTGKYTHRGYKYILNKNNHGKKQDRYTLEHVIIAEHVLGRKLNRGHEIVHHIDCNKGNNKNNNLLICDRSYHSWLHWKMSEAYGQQIIGRRR